jgi:hypothetical protein
MSDPDNRDSPKFDYHGRLLDSYSGKVPCLVNECDPSLAGLSNPVILAVSVVDGDHLPPAEKPWKSLYHQLISECRDLCLEGETRAIKGDFIVQIRCSWESTKSRSDFYVGLPSWFNREIGLEETQLNDNFHARNIPEAWKMAARQHIEKCLICEEWMDIIVWAEPQGTSQEFIWAEIRKKRQVHGRRR